MSFEDMAQRERKGVIVYSNETGEVYGYGYTQKSAWLHAVYRMEKHGEMNGASELPATGRLLRELMALPDPSEMSMDRFWWWLNDQGLADLDEQPRGY